MKLKELKLEELTVKQKLGLVNTVALAADYSDEIKEYVVRKIRDHAVGAVWIQWSRAGAEECIKMVREAADYPILIFTDAENGMGEYLVGKHNSIGCTGDEKYAYAFGKATAVTARKMGYNVVCNPLMDIKTGGGVRAYGSDKDIIAKMAAAEARGMHDGGLLTVGKHYPSGRNPLNIDSHMAETYEDQTEEDLIEYSLYAYKKLIAEGLLDGIMSGHQRFINIDPDRPTSLSKKMLDIARSLGFEGFFITDDLGMMGVRSKFGKVESKGLAIAAGNDLALPYNREIQANQEAIDACYEKGIITDERLDNAVKRILAAQHKTMLLEETRARELTEEEIYLVKHINKDSIYAQAEEGLPTALPRDGKYFFALMVRNEEKTSEGTVEVDTFNNSWLRPTRVIAKIKELFPNSTVYAFHQFPNQEQNHYILNHSLKYDGVIFLTFCEPLAFMGEEHLTRRTEILIRAMQYTNRISTLIHFGNPCVLGELPHISRYILGGLSAESIDTCIEVLAGEYEAKGVRTYDFKLN